MKNTRPSTLARASLLALGLGFASALCAQSSIITTTADYSALDVTPTLSLVNGGFTVYDQELHHWNGDEYEIRTADGTDTVLATYTPDIPIASNGFGDAFGLYDPDNDIFYVGTYDWSGSGLYSYDAGTDTWTDLGVFDSLYAGAVHDGDVYVSGLNAIWTGGVGQDNQIALYDLTGAGNHDVLIQATGNSASVAVDSNGDVYYASYEPSGSSRIYKWTKAQIDSVRADQPGGGTAGGGAGDKYLTYADATVLAPLPSGTGANGIAVDEDFNVFVTYNGSSSGLLVWKSASATTEVIGTFTFWGGYISTYGDFFDGGAVYVNSYGSGIAEVTYTPVP
ncbi:hypothetical protein OPIT5_26335 [Opitutaceae bacterium TAV5]|nr:hypothetical protein OPIT5_26335 [Opitutaceae bacterium TAV5]